jgi:hypothetical protein
MSDWNRDSLTEEFRGIALKSEREGIYWSQKAAKGVMGADVNHDRALAEFYVYNYLHGKSFLVSRDALLAELRVFKDVRTHISGAFNQDLFQEVRERILSGLISHFEADAAAEADQID